MRVETTTRTLYKFVELSESAKESAVDNLRDIEVQHDGWWDGAFEDAKMVGNLIGIDIENIYFRGFSSQGDGACFEGDYRYKKGWKKALKSAIGGDDLPEILKIGNALQEQQRRYFYGISATTKQSGHYLHSGCMDVDCSFDDHPNDGYWDDVSDAEKEITDQLRLFADWIYRKLEKEYEFLTADASVIQMIEANDYEFTEDGELS